MAEACGLREADVRVVVPDMGGGFGPKQHFTREECAVAMLARVTGRTVRWSQDRLEALTGGIHAREQVHDLEVGYDDDGHVLAYKATITSNIGWPVLYFSGVGPSLVTIGSLSGGYDFGAVGFDLRCVATTTAPVGAYRGFGQPQAHLGTERVLDRIAGELGSTPSRSGGATCCPTPPTVDHRHRRPHRPRARSVRHLDQLVDAFDMDGWRDRQAAARADGRHVGIGVSMLVQGTAPDAVRRGRGGSGRSRRPPWRCCPTAASPSRSGPRARARPTRPCWPRWRRTALGTDPDCVTVRDGDTDALPYGMGTWGSRSAVMGGGAVLEAAGQVRRSVDRIAACLPGTPTLAEVAEAAWLQPHTLPPGLDAPLAATAVFSPGGTIPVPDEHGHTNFDETSAASATAAGGRGRHRDGPASRCSTRCWCRTAASSSTPPWSRGSTRAGSPRRSAPR